jgi:hypothetical protein
MDYRPTSEETSVQGEIDFVIVAKFDVLKLVECPSFQT